MWRSPWLFLYTLSAKLLFPLALATFCTRKKVWVRGTTTHQRKLLQQKKAFMLCWAKLHFCTFISSISVHFQCNVSFCSRRPTSRFALLPAVITCSYCIKKIQTHTHTPKSIFMESSNLNILWWRGFKAPQGAWRAPLPCQGRVKSAVIIL